MLPQGLKDFPNVFQVFFPTLAKYEDVIQVYNHEWIGEGLHGHL